MVEIPTRPYLGMKIYGSTPGQTLKVDQSGAVSGTSSLPAAMQGLNTYLTFVDHNGLILTDMSGNGHNATISTTGGTQVFTPQGLKLVSETATLPANAGLPSFGVCAYFPAGSSTGFSVYQYVTAATASAQIGYNNSTSYNAPYGHGFLAYFPQVGQSAGTAATQSADGFTGPQCFEFVVSTTSGGLDHIYGINGEVKYYAQGTTYQALGGAQLANAITFSANSAGGLTTSVLYSFWNVLTQDTAATAAARIRSEVARLTALGVSFGDGVNKGQSSTNACVVEGTSIDQGFMASQTPSSLLSLDFTCPISLVAVSGQASRDMDAAFPDRVAPLYAPRAAKNIAYHGGVTNSLSTVGETVVDALNDVLSWNKKAHAAGFSTIASTMMSRCVTGTGGLSGDVLAQQFNALLLTYGDLFDWVANVAAFPQLGATNSCSNTTYFADGTHLTNTGQTGYVAAMRAGFEGVVPNWQRTITANYTQAPADRLLVANAGSGITLTLIDANTASFNKAGKLCVHNIGAGTVTLATVSSQTIDGAAPGTIATGATVCVIPFVAVAATGGANWVKTQP